MSDASHAACYLWDSWLRVTCTWLAPQVWNRVGALGTEGTEFPPGKIYGTHRVAVVPSHHPVIQLAINFPYK